MKYAHVVIKVGIIFSVESDEEAREKISEMKLCRVLPEGHSLDLEQFEVDKDSYFVSEER